MKGFNKVLGLALAGLGCAVSSAFAMDLGKVNGKVITDKDLKAALNSLNEGQRANILKDAGSRKQVLNSLVDQELLAQEAEKEKLDQDAEYKEALASFRKQYLSSKVLQKNLGSKLTDSSAKKYYNAHRDRYSTDEVHALHILLSDEQSARDAMKKLEGKDDDAFKAMAEEISKDPSAKNNRGDLGFFSHERMVPEFTEPAFAAKPGEIVGPVKTAYGYHIIKVVERKTGKAIGYEEIELRVKNDMRQDLIQSYVGKLREHAKIQVDDKAVEKM